MWKKLRKGLRLCRRRCRIYTLCGIVVSAAMCLLLTRAASAFDFNDILRSYSTDFKRVDVVEMKSRFASVIENVTGMKPRGDVRIVYKSRGDVKQESFKLDMESQNMSGAESFAAYEYLLKQFGLIDADADLRELLFDSLYDQVYGFYEPGKNSLAIVEHTNPGIAASILMHELVHAAQDATVDLKKYLSDNCKSMDACMASSALLEGQASMAQLLIGIEQNLKDKSAKEILDSVHEQIQASGDRGGEEKKDFLTNVRLFPYTEGLKFVLERYRNNERFPDMFKRIPATSEQVLHPEKFQADERPEKTGLGEKKNACSRISGAKLVFDSSFGEYYIRAILEKNLAGGPEKPRKAASGWGGDTIFVFHNGRGWFLVWDTLWDTPEDAGEFYESFLGSCKTRYNLETFDAGAESEILLHGERGTLRVTKAGKRVLIVEGELTPAQLEFLRKVLG